MKLSNYFLFGGVPEPRHVGNSRPAPTYMLFLFLEAPHHFTATVLFALFLLLPFLSFLLPFVGRPPAPPPPAPPFPPATGFWVRFRAASFPLKPFSGLWDPGVQSDAGEVRGALGHAAQLQAVLRWAASAEETYLGCGLGSGFLGLVWVPEAPALALFALEYGALKHFAKGC